MRYDIPSYCIKVLDMLTSAGYECYVVGGAVRDLVMGRVPSDYDVTTSAMPSETIDVLTSHGIRYLPTGLKHGTVMALVDGVTVEITTYRIDGGYSDSRHPDSVTFTRDICGDVARRDFTMNAMYLDKDGCVRDEVGGLADIASGIIRAVGDAKIRFREDALRILRGVRFAAQTGFDIEPSTYDAMVSCAPLLANIAGERIAAELNGFLTAPYAASVFGPAVPVLSVFVPSVDAEVTVPVLERLGGPGALSGAGSCSRDLSMALAALLLPCGVDGASGVLSDLRYANEIRDKVLGLLGGLELEIVSSREDVHFFMSRLGVDMARDTVIFRRAAEPSSAGDCDGVLKVMSDLVASGAVFCVTDLEISGKDVIALGVAPGPEVGVVLKRIFEMYVRGEVPNEHEALVKAARAFL